MISEARIAPSVAGRLSDVVEIDQRSGGVARRGTFWDIVEGRRDPPSAAILLGWQLVAVDPDAGTIEVSFTASEQMLNAIGNVQGGFLAAMRDKAPASGCDAAVGERIVRIALGAMPRAMKERPRVAVVGGGIF